MKATLLRGTLAGLAWFGCQSSEAITEGDSDAHRQEDSYARSVASEPSTSETGLQAKSEAGQTGAAADAAEEPAPTGGEPEAMAPREAGGETKADASGTSQDRTAGAPGGKGSAEEKTGDRDRGYAEAEQLYRTGEYHRAVEGFSGYVERNPDVAPAHTMRALALMKVKRTEDAVASFERALELDPGYVPGRLALARAWIELNRYDAARTHVQLVLNENPDHNEAHRVLGRVHHSRGQAEAAIAAYRKAAALDPTDAWAMNNLGLVLIERERFEEALLPLARAVQLRPGEPVFQNNLGVALERTGYFADAAAAYRAAVEAAPGHVKASVSLDRVEARAPGSKPFDLDRAAERFLTSIAEPDSGIAGGEGAALTDPGAGSSETRSPFRTAGSENASKRSEPPAEEATKN
jgi:Flp pilus assembly protein TadD